MGAVDKIVTALRTVIPTFAKSDGSIEAKIIDIVGEYADSETLERENSVNIIMNALSQQKITTENYYRRRATEFQYGDVLSYDPVNFGAYYKEIKPESQIVKQAYIVGEFPQYILLVNAIGSDRHLRPLSANELSSIRTYFKAFQPIGMDILINSLNVATIFAPNIVIHVRAGTDATTVAEEIRDNFIAYESVPRPYNTVSITELVDIIQQVDSVVAVGMGDISAVEQQLDGSYLTTYPEEGIFTLTNGAFIFGTEITNDNIKVLV